MIESTTAGTEARPDTDAPPNKKPADLSKFQLRVLAVPNDADEAPKGVTVKTRLQVYYDEVNHGRLYLNLNGLVAAGLVLKGIKDKRTNAYDITDAGRDALKKRTRVAGRTRGRLHGDGRITRR